MGKGDKRTARGKRFRHSFGNSRPKSTKKTVVAKKPAKAARKKAAK